MVAAEHMIAPSPSTTFECRSPGKKGYFELGIIRSAGYLYKGCSLNPYIFQNQDDMRCACCLKPVYRGGLCVYFSPEDDPKIMRHGIKRRGICKDVRNDEAIAAFNQSIQIYPDSAEVWNNLGSVHFHGQYENARAFESDITG